MSEPPAISVRVLEPGDDVSVVDATLHAVWGGPQPVVRRELLVALVHSESFVALASTNAGMPVGASVALLGLEQGSGAQRAITLHSHVTGVVPALRASGIGWALKQCQRDWATARGITAITWTFDPLVRRNAWFNITRLGVEVVAYHAGFYGEMVDEINAGDESDRLYVRWSIGEDRERATGVADVTVPTPEDVVELRRRDPAAVAAWRARHREALQASLDAGGRVLGFTPDGDYLIQSAR